MPCYAIIYICIEIIGRILSGGTDGAAVFCE